MKTKPEEVKTEEAPKTRGRKKLTPEEKEINRKYKLLEEFKKTLGIEDPVDVGDDGSKEQAVKQVLDRIDLIKTMLKNLRKEVNKI